MWRPIYSHPDKFNLVRAASGMTVSCRNTFDPWPQLGAYMCGVLSVGYFRPYSLGTLDIEVAFDSYRPATDYSATRCWHVLIGFVDAKGHLYGLVYGCWNAGGNEEFYAVTYDTHGNSYFPAKIAGVNIGANVPIPDGSAFTMRMRAEQKYLVPAPVFEVNFFGLRFAEFAMAAHGILYRKTDLTAVGDAVMQATPQGFRLFIGAFSNANSTTGRAQIRALSATMHSGMHTIGG
jgi:hypothetical protein